MGYCSNVRLIVCLIIVLFGMGSWIAINGIWVELPLLVEQLPEGWNLPSYMAVVIQLANVGPIAYTISKVCCKRKNDHIPIVFLMVAVGSLASLLLAFFWTRTTEIGGAEHSTSLLVLMFFLSLVDCTSSVVFLPFMNVFKPDYMTSYYVGEGFSGLVPSLVALGQGVGQVECQNISSTNMTTNETKFQISAVYQEPKFPVKDFFFFVFAMMVTCGVAFTLLNYLPICKGEHVSLKTKHKYDTQEEMNMSSTQKFVNSSHNSEETSESDINLEQQTSDASLKLSSCSYFYLLLIILWTNALTNGVLPSVQTYSCLPYGSQTYHLAVTFSQIANPIACGVAFFLPVTSGGILGLATLTGSAISAYILALATLSPVPPLTDSAVGSVLAVSSISFSIPYK